MDNSDTPNTRTQSKRGLKRERRREEWQRRKKEKQDLRAEACQAESEERKNHGPSKRTLAKLAIRAQAIQKLHTTDPTRIVHVAFDLGFESTMTPGELNSMVRQVRTCCHENALKGEHNPFAIHLLRFGGVTEEKFREIPDFESWCVRLHDRGTEVFTNTADSLSSKLANVIVQPDPVNESKAHRLSSELTTIYLSPDASEVLQSVEPGHVYVIGGIVDRNREKKMSKNAAVSTGIRSARLPIKEEVGNVTVDILSLVAVFNILTSVSNGTEWAIALREHLPKRIFQQKDSLIKEATEKSP